MSSLIFHLWQVFSIFHNRKIIRCNLLFSQRVVFLFHNCHMFVSHVGTVWGELMVFCIPPWCLTLNEMTGGHLHLSLVSALIKINYDHLCHLALLKRDNGLVRWGTAASSPLLRWHIVLHHLQSGLKASDTSTLIHNLHPGIIKVFFFLPGILSSPLLGSAGLATGSAMGSVGLLTLALSGEDLGFFKGSAQVGFLPSWSWLVNFSCW